MSSSTLTPGNLPAGPDRRIHQGHGTSALGPSDSSDSGSDKPSRESADIDTDHVERIVPPLDDAD